ncbi:MAG: T9SS type A sorting domain-containing protein [Bacteroidota bacterium]
MKKATIILCFTFSITLLSAQNASDNREVHVIPCSYFGISKPLIEIMEYSTLVEDVDNEERVESTDRLYRMPQKFKFSVNDGEEYGEDPSVRQTSMGNRQSLGPLVNWAGQTGNAYPPDPTGAAGLNHYVQAVNLTTFKIFNKTTGAASAAVSLGSLWNPAVSNYGDPIVLYDKYADRWFISQFGQGSPNKIYIAISTSSNPNGTYYTYTFTSSEFPDYLKFSIWDDGYYMTSQQTTDKVFCFERDKMLAGNPAARSISVNFNTGTVSGFYIPLPADADGVLPPAGTPLPFFSYYDNAWGGGNDAIKVWSMSVNWIPTTPTAIITNSPTVINTSAFDASYNIAWNDIPQPIHSQRLDGLGGVCMFRAQWRKWATYNSVVLNFAVQISSNPIKRGIRWCELHQDQITNQWSLYQEGTFALSDATNRFMGSIAMNGEGSIGMCYAILDSLNGISASLAYTGRLASDPLGTMSFAETVAIAGSGAQTANNRFGDYSHTSIDPSDDVTFWHTGEYLVNGGVATRIYSFKLPLGNGIAENNSENTIINAFQQGYSLIVNATQLPNADELQVDLFDAQGKLLNSKKVIPVSNSFETSFDISNLALGTYLVRIGKANSYFQKVKKVILK